MVPVPLSGLSTYQNLDVGPFHAACPTWRLSIALPLTQDALPPKRSLLGLLARAQHSASEAGANQSGHLVSRLSIPAERAIPDFRGLQEQTFTMSCVF